MGLVNQYDIFIINLDPTIGSEIKKTRPCVVISPDEMNKYLNTIIIAPITSRVHNYPTRVRITLSGKRSEIMLDQIRTVDIRRLIKRVSKLNFSTITKVKNVIFEMLVA